ncbi:glycosyltransferase family 1 protein [Flavobacteriaceae bacterium]|nr:glycosyltransferase family 1 protein [Flavobacteriaceae bacterium]
MLKIIYPRNIKNDERKSMDIYADLVQLEISREFKLINFFPKKNNFYQLFSKRNSDRFNRLFSHYWFLRRNKFKICHIIDHSYSHLLMYLPKFVKSVVTVHDIIPILIWKNKITGIKKSKPPILFKYSMYCLKYASKIVTISNNTKNDLIEVLNIDPKKIVVIKNSVSKVFKVYSSKEKKLFAIHNNFNNKCHNVIIFSNSELYKNTNNSLTACNNFNLKSIKKIKIHLVGKLDDKLKLLLSNDFNCEVCFYSNISNIDLAMLYNVSDVLLFPSLYEGFGMPIIESMSCGTPVISSKRGSIPEISENNLIYCDPVNIKSITEKLVYFFSNEKKRKILISKGINISKKYLNKNMSCEYSELYKSLL